MDLELTITAPAGREVSEDLVPELRRSLNRLQVAYSIKESSAQNAVLQLIDTTESEERLVVRLLLRAGYDIETEAP